MASSEKSIAPMLKTEHAGKKDIQRKLAKVQFHSSSVCRLKAHYINDFGLYVTPLRVCETIGDNLIVQCAETSKYLVWIDLNTSCQT